MSAVPQASPRFDFGDNWKSFSDSALTPEGITRARADFRALLRGIPLEGATFLDIGFGQGLALCLAYESGARPYGNDINLKCIDALRSTAVFFPSFRVDSIPIVVGSILDDATVQKLRALGPATESRDFDVVHSWGVLHHTGAMYQAIRRVASLVRPGGHLVLAIYNAHWSSPLWRPIKAAYVRVPPFVQRIFVRLLFPIIFFAKLAVTRENPLKKDRGMDFYHDVVDWVGGYPYEYASAGEIKTLVESLGYDLERLIPATVPTGCNQFVFRAAPPLSESSARSS